MQSVAMFPSVMSSIQQRLWFLDQLESDAAAVVLQARLSLKGTLDVGILRDALTDVTDRHTILRTTFSLLRGAPAAVLTDPFSPVLSFLDLGNGADASPHDIENRLRAEEDLARQSLHVEKGPLLRLTLVKRAEADYVLLLCCHRILADRASLVILVSEIGRYYAVRLAKTPEQAPAVAPQYHDYAAAQNRVIEAGEWKPRLDHWRRQLGNSTEPLQLATDRPRPPFQTHRIETVSRTFAATVWAGVQTIATDLGVRCEVVLLSAFHTLLARTSGQHDFNIGWVDTTRSQTLSLAQGIGPYEELLPLRTSTSANSSYADLARQLETTLAEAQQNEVPFEILMQTLQPPRETSFHPLCQVRFLVQNSLKSPIPMGDSVTSGSLEISEPSKFDLTLLDNSSPEYGTFALDYNADLFDRSTAEHMLRRLETLLQSAVDRPEVPLTALNLLAAEEREQLVHGWNRTEWDVDETLSLVASVEAQVDRAPDQIAALFVGESWFGSATWTYHDLDGYANRMARLLIRLGVEVGDRVGICLPRGCEMLGAVLGVLKAGAAYVPLDPAYPKERLAFMLEDAAPSVIVTDSTLTGLFPETHSAARILVDQDRERIEREYTSRLQITERDLQGADDRLIYITYTSGSTGKPKGIEMTQRPLQNLLRWMLRTTRLPELARTLQFASLSFDVSFQDIFSSLLSGGALVLISEEQRRDIAGLWNVIVKQGVHRIFLPAVALQQLAEGFRPEFHSRSQLRKVISGSEQLLVTPAVLQMFRSLPACRLHNEYGPSETHVVTEYALPVDTDQWPHRPFIGRPIDNTTLYILGRDGDLSPTGIPGELYIGGAGLARGYRDRPEETLARFLPDTFSGLPGCRLYRTGDRARYLPDGTLEFLGRLDHQVKVRGYRVEPAEIEGMLERHPAVQEAAVVALEVGTPSAYLAAYLAVEGDPPPTVTDLREFLSERLPDYLIPSAFVLMDRLPLNANGKVDRKALPKPDQQRPELGSVYAPPTTDQERAVLEIWSKVLGVEKIGVDDSFFDLGGHSMRLVQVQARLREALRREVAVVDLFRYYTIRTLAQFLSREKPQEMQLSEVQERALRQRQALARRGPARRKL